MRRQVAETALPALPLPPLRTIFTVRPGCDGPGLLHCTLTARCRSGRLPDDELGRRSGAAEAGGFCTVSCSMSISAAIRPASNAGHSTPVSAGRQHLGELGGDHRHDREVVRDVEVGRAQRAEQAGELPTGGDRRRALAARIGAAAPRPRTPRAARASRVAGCRGCRGRGRAARTRRARSAPRCSRRRAGRAGS